MAVMKEEENTGSVLGCSKFVIHSYLSSFVPSAFYTYHFVLHLHFVVYYIQILERKKQQKKETDPIPGSWVSGSATTLLLAITGLISVGAGEVWIAWEPYWQWERHSLGLILT